MLNRPKFLSTPPLYEDGSALVSWENTADADAYELDIVFGETFDEAGHGKSWDAVGGGDWTWEDQTEANGKTWAQLAALPAQGLMWRNIEFFDKEWEEWDADLQATWEWMQEHSPVFTAYKGPGEDVPAPDQGMEWSTIEAFTWDWSGQDEPNGLSWKEIALLPSAGLEWSQHDSDQLTWDEFEAKYDNWKSLQTQPTRGLAWESMAARRLDWTGFEALGENSGGLSWGQLEHLPPDNQTQKGYEVKIPLYAKRSMLRVRSVSDNDSSEYLTTDMLGHLPRSLAKYKPPCLHISELHEGKPADIVWGDLYGASAYVLERALDAGDFSGVFDGSGSLAPHPTDCEKPDELYYTPDCKLHLAGTDQIPYYAKTARYRIKGYNSTDSSRYLESAAVPIIPVFYRDDSMRLTVTAGEAYWVQLHAKGIHDFTGILMRLVYPADLLELEEALADDTMIAEQRDGEITFRCNRPVPSGKEWSGGVMLVRFTALKTVTTDISLS